MSGNKASLLNEPFFSIATALDKRDATAAWAALALADPFALTPVEGDVLRSLAKRALAQDRETGGARLAQAGLHVLDRAAERARNGHFWDLFALFEAAASQRVPPERLAVLIALALGPALQRAPAEVQTETMTRLFLGGQTALLTAAWRHVLAHAPGFVPDFWQYQALARSLSEAGSPDGIADILRDTRADRLVPLFDVYADLLGQRHLDRGFARAARLTDPDHRFRVASWLLGASQPADRMAAAVALHDTLSGPGDRAERDFMQARLAVTEDRWTDALRLTAPLLETGPLRHPALCLHALAQSRTGQTDAAEHALRHLRATRSVPWFLRGRAGLIGLSLRAARDGTPVPGRAKAPDLAIGPGRPLAQSLWIGKRLRWIERASIQSYLLNGWRYQLFVYDIPDNVPGGVELMDASAILPRGAVFREGAGSGMHRGSVGAFSDVFRYALLARRGGMWTDTDVINLDPFDPEGARFIATEVSDAGIVGTNGAMMAAPAGCALQHTALDRAMALARRDDMHFARIGPELLAELIATDGLQGYDLLPVEFLNPIGWMDTGRLLDPFAEVARDPRLTTARNLHVYTETWRLIGLDLHARPTDGGFLAHLAERLDDPGLAAGSVREVLAA